MNNFVSEGKVIQKVATGTVSSGDFVALEDRAGVAMADYVSGDTMEILVEGIVEYDMAADTIAAGEKLYYDSGADNLTTTAGSNKAAGWAAGAKASTETTVHCKLGAF